MRFSNKSTRALTAMKNEIGYGAQAMAVASMDTPSYMIDEFIEMTEEISSREELYRKASLNANPDAILEKLLEDFRAVVERRVADKIVSKTAYGFEIVDGSLVLNARNPCVDEIVLTPVPSEALAELPGDGPRPSANQGTEHFANGIENVPISHALFSLRYQIPITNLIKQFPDLSQLVDLPGLGTQKCEALRLAGTACGRMEFHLRGKEDGAKLEAVTVWCI